MVNAVCIEVPEQDNNGWVDLQFELLQTPAPDEQPLKLNKTRSDAAKMLQNSANTMLARLRHAFFSKTGNKESVHRQICLSVKLSELQPNLRALNLALLLADLHFKQVVILSDHVALEAGYCLHEGFISLPSCLVAPSNRQADTADQDVRNSLVYRLNEEKQLKRHYETPNYNFELLKQVVAIAPQVIYRACVYYPVVDTAGNSHELSEFNVYYLPDERFKLTVIEGDNTFRFLVNDFIRNSADLSLLLKGQVLVECGERPSKDHNSWQLALVSALQIALGVMLVEPSPLICTGEIKTDPDAPDYSRQVAKVGQCDLKYLYIQQLYENKKILNDAFGQPATTVHWFFCLPEENYYQLQIDADTGINTVAVDYWFVNDLMEVV